MSPSGSPGPAKSRARNVVYVCKAVDADDPTVATQVRWIASLASNPRIGRVVVLTRCHGRADLPANVEVRPFASGRAAGWAATISGFLAQSARLRPRDVDFFFVAQGGPYPALLLPLKVVLRRPLYQWKAQPHVSARMAFYARWCDDLIFTATTGSFPASAKPGGVEVVGHGIDTELFRPPDDPIPATLRRDLVAVGRVSPIKRLDIVLGALARCRERTGAAPTLDIVGPGSSDDAYRRRLETMVAELDLAGSVRFLGQVAHDDLPTLLAGYRGVVNFSDTAFDKAAGEAMACGLPVVTTNPCTVEMLPIELVPTLSAARDDPGDQARAIAELLAWDQPTRAAASERLRTTIVANHGLDTLFDKILDTIEGHEDAAGPLARPGSPDGPHWRTWFARRPRPS